MKNILLVTGFLVSSPLMANSSSLPSYQGLFNAKQLCMGMAKRVKALIAQAQAPEDSRPGLLGVGDEADSEVFENDTAALFALQGMGRGTFALGQSLDQALAHYGSPDFLLYQQNVCAKTALLFNANQGARTASALPSVGVITPYEFDQFDQEIAQVKAETFCF